MMLILLPFQKQVVAAEQIVIPLSCSCTVVNFAEFMSLSRVEKNTLGRSSLTRVDVRHDTDVSGML